MGGDVRIYTLEDTRWGKTFQVVANAQNRILFNDGVYEPPERQIVLASDSGIESLFYETSKFIRTGEKVALTKFDISGSIPRGMHRNIISRRLVSVEAYQHFVERFDEYMMQVDRINGEADDTKIPHAAQVDVRINVKAIVSSAREKIEKIEDLGPCPSLDELLLSPQP